MRIRQCALIVLVALVVAAPAAASGGTVAFTRGTWAWADYALGGGDLYTVSLDGTGLRDLTPEDTDTTEIGARWSHDGRRLAFVRMLTSADPLETLPAVSIWTMNADGTDQRRLTGDVATALHDTDTRSGCGGLECFATFSASWSPDDRTLVYARSTGEEVWQPAVHLWTMRADGSRKRQLTRGRHLDTSPAWAPNARWIAFYRRDVDGYHGALYLVHPDGTGLRRFRPTTFGADDEPLPAWSPDSTRLVWAAPGRGLAITSVRTGRTTYVPRLPPIDRAGGAFAPSWGVAGIAFESTLSESGRTGIWITSPDGRAARSLTTPDLDSADVFPALRP